MNANEFNYEGAPNAAAEANLRAGVAAWVEEGRAAIPASERLRRIRATQFNVAPRLPERSVLRAWNADADRRHPRRWPLWSLAALLAVVALAGLAYLARTPKAPSQARQIPDEEKKSKPGREVKQPPAVVAAQISAGAKDVFVREADRADATWELAVAGQPCAPKCMIQLAANAEPAELAVFTKHRVKLAPGTLVRLGDDPANPAVDLWRGRIEVWAGNESLTVGSLSQEHTEKNQMQSGHHRRDLVTLQAGEHATIETAMLKTRTIEVAGLTLLDEKELQPVACRVVRGASEDPGVRIQPGTANLLNVIDGGFTGVPVAEIAQALQDLLNVRVRLSPGAQKEAGAVAVTLNLGQVTGAEALAALAEKAGLVVQIREGDVVLELPGEDAPKTVPPKDEDF